MSSVFRPYIDANLEELHQNGFKLEYVETFYDEFDRYCEAKGIKEAELTKELAEQWVFGCKTESRQQLDKRVRTMKHLARYMISVGKEAYLFQRTIRYEKPKPPTLLSDSELIQYFSFVDTGYHYTGRIPYASAIFPVMFRLIYSCGLRQSEARLLKRSDYYPGESKILIANGKDNRDRIVFVHPTMNELLMKFDESFDSRFHDRVYMFEDVSTNKPITKFYVSEIFYKILRDSSVEVNTAKRQTLHGLRHLFAVHNMRRCLAGDRDFGNWIKYLSQYMGHASPQETMYYLHSVVDGLPEYSRKISSFEKEMEVVYEEK